MGDTTKKLLLIGASRGLGLAVAAEYLKRGWNVVATELSHSPALHELLEASEGMLEVERVDVTSAHQISALRSRLEGRRFDLLFHNAGVTNPEKEIIAEVSTFEFERVMVTNTLSPLRVLEACKISLRRAEHWASCLLARAASPTMKRRMGGVPRQ